MTALMSNLDDSSAYTSCVVAAGTTSAEILVMLDFTNTTTYVDGSFNIGSFLTEVNVVFIKLMDQNEVCGLSELYIQWDRVLDYT